MYEPFIADAEWLSPRFYVVPGLVSEMEDVPVEFGDRAIGVHWFGPDHQHVVVVWVSDNLLQIVSGLVPNNESPDAVFELVAAIAQRTE